MEASWFKGRLVELRMAKGYSRKALAERAGLQSEAGIRNLEQGRTLPSWDMVLALCKALGVGCDAFTQEPTGDYKPQPGRPRKAEEAAAPAPEDVPAKRRTAKGKASGEKKGKANRK